MTKIREFSTRWGRPNDRTFFERDLEAMVGSAKDSPLDTPNFRPFDMLAEPNDSRVIWQNDDMRIGVESLSGTAPAFRRGCDYDELWFQFAGHTLVESEYGTSTWARPISCSSPAASLIGAPAQAGACGCSSNCPSRWTSCWAKTRW